MFLISGRLKNLNSEESKERIEDLSSIKFRFDALQSNAIEEEDGESLKEPELVLYKDGDISSVINYTSPKVKSDQYEIANYSTSVLEINGTNLDEQDHKQIQQEKPTPVSGQKELSKQNTTVRQNIQLQNSKGFSDVKVKEIRDQLIRARAYLKFTPPGSNSQLVKELKVRIKELERSVGDATKDSALSKGALKRSRGMEGTLAKASRVYSDCPAMVSKLRAMTYNAEEQGRMTKKQASFLIQLAGKTTPKGLHCLSMRLTAEYFSLPPEEQVFPNQDRLPDPNLYHFAVFSDNILACAVVVNSTISASGEPEKIVFHIVTNSINVPAMSMWFLLNPPVNSAIQIQSIESFKGLFRKYGATLGQQNSRDPRFISELNYLRFYLPEMFPFLDKIVLFDHDVVVQRDLAGLWDINLEGKVNGAVETCHEGEPVYRQMDMYVNFSDPMVAKRFNNKACTWAFGMNIFNLEEWRKRNLTGVYRKYLQMGRRKPLWKAGSLPLGWVTFYNRTLGLDRTWQALGLGYDSGVKQEQIDRAAVIHFDGIMKPWLDIGLEKYKGYWRRHVNYDHPYLQQCNIQR